MRSQGAAVNLANGPGPYRFRDNGRGSRARATCYADSIEGPHRLGRPPPKPLGGTTLRGRPACFPRPAILAAMDIQGVTIRTIIGENVAIRCDGCREIIPGRPWRMNLLDIAPTETPVSWTERPVINPGPHQFHADPACPRRWMAEHGYLFCRKGIVREIMRPVPLPTDPPSFGLCDGFHRDDHELVPA